jgi:hypothetical protein
MMALEDLPIPQGFFYGMLLPEMILPLRGLRFQAALWESIPFFRESC